MGANIARHLLFIWSREDDFGVFMLRALHEFMSNFALATSEGKTWADVLGRIGKDGVDFIRPFLESDDLSKALTPEQELDKIRRNIWIFYAQEFPLTQCVETSYSAISRIWAAGQA